MVVDGSALTNDVRERFDVVIIGSGAGGAVLAKELAQGGVRVAVIEDGHYWKTTDHVDLPSESISRMYRDRGYTTTLGIPIIPIPLGRALGGTTVINSGTCFRTPSKIFRYWNEKLGLTELTEVEFVPLFERVEREIHVEEADYAVMSRANTLFHELLARRGVQGKALRRNIKGCEGCGFCCYGCPSGAKQSMEVSYLPRAFAAGATAYTNCTVRELILKGKTVTGVRGVFHAVNGPATGRRLELTAGAVVVAAGTILTPQLLRDNGIALENPHLGRNLTIHPATKVFARFDEKINGWEGTPQAYYLDVLENEGILFEGIFLPPDVAAMSVPFVGRRMNEFMRDYRHMATFGVMISDSGSGRVIKMPFLGTRVLYNLLSEDMRKFRKGVAYLCRVFLEGGARKIYTLLHGHVEIETEEDIRRLENAKIPPEDFDGMAFHPLGTCRMARDAENGVVDTEHRVFGWEGIYVCDGSVIPSALGVNPQETIMAFATRLAQRMLRK